MHSARRTVYTMLMVTGPLVLWGCAILPGSWHAHPNEPGRHSTRANLVAEDIDVKDGMFIGVAISGGGSRAANFGAAVLLELKEQLGAEHPIDVVSSVSGGSLPASYFALDHYQYGWFNHHEIRFSKSHEAEIKDLLQRNFQIRFVARWLLPWNIVRFWLSDFNRTDIMFPVLDANLYHGATFANLTTGPKLIINSSEMGDPQPFPFVDETFATLHSDLSLERISVAVAASMAVPGLYHHVVLTDQRVPPSLTPYRHLSDAAVVDNLGLHSLLTMLRGVTDGGRSFPNGCVLIAIDAAPAFLPWKRSRAETREFQDYLFDRNGSDAIDFILLDQRARTLQSVGMHSPDAPEPASAFSEWTSPDGTFTCRFWHIALRRVLVADDDLTLPLDTHWDALPWPQQIRLIPTELNILDWQQRALFTAGQHLVKRGWEARAKTWFHPPAH